MGRWTSKSSPAIRVGWHTSQKNWIRAISNVAIGWMLGFQRLLCIPDRSSRYANCDEKEGGVEFAIVNNVDWNSFVTEITTPYKCIHQMKLIAPHKFTLQVHPSLHMSSLIQSGSKHQFMHCSYQNQWSSHQSDYMRIRSAPRYLTYVFIVDIGSIINSDL